MFGGGTFENTAADKNYRLRQKRLPADSSAMSTSIIASTEKRLKHDDAISLCIPIFLSALLGTTTRDSRPGRIAQRQNACLKRPLVWHENENSFRFSSRSAAKALEMDRYFARVQLLMCVLLWKCAGGYTRIEQRGDGVVEIIGASLSVGKLGLDVLVGAKKTFLFQPVFFKNSINHCPS